MIEGTETYFYGVRLCGELDVMVEKYKKKSNLAVGKLKII